MDIISRYKCKKCGFIIPANMDVRATMCPECGASKWKKYDEKERLKELLLKNKK